MFSLFDRIKERKKKFCLTDDCELHGCQSSVKTEINAPQINQTRKSILTRKKNIMPIMMIFEKKNKNNSSFETQKVK